MEAIVEKTIEQLTAERFERAIAFSKAMMERKRETKRQMQEEWKTNPEKRLIFDDLIKENEARGSRIIKL
jgi:hypothetical protein